VFLQIFLAWYASRPSTPWWQFWVLAYVVGGTASHSLTLAIHEMSHNLFFSKARHNVWYGFFANWPLIVPYSNSFKKYHLEHHRYQGVDGTDVDIPTTAEGKFFTTPFRKFLWVFFQAAFYAIRPLIVNPKPLNSMDFVNISSQAAFVTAIYLAWGPYAVLYMALSTFHGLGFHPCAGHFIAEHYTNLSSQSKGHKTGQTPFIKGGDKLYPDETFTYRGPLNMFSYNVGIHVAHHDFPFVSGLRLAEVEKLAPEFYDHLPVTKSWPGTIYNYIMSDCTPFDRIKRKTVTGGDPADGTKKER
jgi:sphingolipid delta-4 desaturase